MIFLIRRGMIMKLSIGMSRFMDFTEMMIRMCCGNMHNISQMWV